MNIVLISGSAREKRRSHAVALALQKALEEQGASLRLLDVKAAALPPLDYRYSRHPEPSETLKSIATDLEWAEAFLLVSPEYNGSYPGALKNTMDYFFSEYHNKPFGIATVSAGDKGGISALRALQQYALSLRGIVFSKGFTTAKTNDLLDENEQIKDADYAARLKKFAKDFLTFASRPQ